MELWLLIITSNNQKIGVNVVALLNRIDFKSQV